MTMLAEKNSDEEVLPVGKVVASVVPLSELAPGESGIVRRIDGGRSLSQRLSAMGILPPRGGISGIPDARPPTVSASASVTDW